MNRETRHDKVVPFAQAGGLRVDLTDPRSNRAVIEEARARQPGAIVEWKSKGQKQGLPYPSLRRLGAYGPQPERRLVYLSKGSGVADGRFVTNPGFPFVKPPKDWAAGGLPLGFDRETALAYMREQTFKPEQETA